MEKINMIISKLVNYKLSKKEVGELVELLILNPTMCPCRLLCRNCDKCKYKTIDQEKETRMDSGCVDAVEYFAIKQVIRFETEIYWEKVLYDALYHALHKYPKLQKMVVENWEI